MGQKSFELTHSNLHSKIRREKSETEERGGARGDTGIYRIEVTFTWASGMLIGRRGYQAAFHVHCTMYILWNIAPIIRIIGEIEITFGILKKKEYSCRLIFPQFSAWYPIAAAYRVCGINIISLICVISFHSHNFEKWWELLKTPQSTTCTFYKWNIRVSNDFFSPDPWWRPGLLSSHRQILRLEFPAHHHQLRGLPVAQVKRNLGQKIVFIICCY